MAPTFLVVAPEGMGVVSPGGCFLAVGEAPEVAEAQAEEDLADLAVEVSAGEVPVVAGKNKIIERLLLGPFRFIRYSVCMAVLQLIELNLF